MKVALDTMLCEAHGLCEATAPEVFRLGDEDTVEVLDEDPAEEHWAAVRTAVGSCPRLALSIVPD